MPNDNYKLNIDEIDLRESILNNNLSEKEEDKEKNPKQSNKEEISEKGIDNGNMNQSEEKKEIKESNGNLENNSLEVDKASERDSKKENEREDPQKKSELDISISEKEKEKKNPKDEKKGDEMDLEIEEMKSYVTEENPPPPNASVSSINSVRNSKIKKSNINSSISKQKEIKNIDIKDVEEKESKNSIDEKNSEKEIKNSSLKPIKTMPQNKSQKLKNSSIKNNLKKSNTTKMVSLIRATITKVEKEEDSLPDISGINDYPILDELSEDEKTLNEIIPDFHKKILEKEKREDIEAREYFLNKNKYLKENTKEGELFSQHFGEYIEHTDLMKKEFNKKGLQNIPSYNTTFEEEIFSEGIFEEMNSPIGGVENMNSFLQKYFFTKNENIAKSSKKFFDKWRRILGDGNSFYRILMFSLFEAYILSNNEELQYIISEISSDEYIEVYKEKEINYQKCFSIFSIILNLLENNNISKAYEILLKSYLLNDFSFDKLLIVYIKHLIVINIEQVMTICKTNKININNSNLNCYKIEAPNIEPSFEIICIIPYLFNINMNILSIKGNLSSPIESKFNFIDSENQESPLISFGYFFSSYYKLYQHDFEKIYNYDLNLIENNNKQLTYILKELQDCKNCEKPTEQIVFLEKKFRICKKCLEDHLSNVCNFRSDSFKEDGYIGLEYYTRPIHLNENYYIDDLEIIELLESLNLSNVLFQKYCYNICNYCDGKNKCKEIIKLRCGCSCCQICIENSILNLANGLKYLTPLEKQELKEEKCPKCKNQFDFEEALKHVKYNNEDVKDSSLRLKKYINILCLVCLKELRKEDLTGNKYVDDNDAKYRKIKIKKNNKNERANGIDYMEIEHLICKQCFLKYLKGHKNELDDEDNENEQNKPVDLEKGIIYCNICCREHNLDAKFLEEGGCCNNCTAF